MPAHHTRSTRMHPPRRTPRVVGDTGCVTQALNPGGFVGASSAHRLAACCGCHCWRVQAVDVRVRLEIMYSSQAHRGRQNRGRGQDFRQVLRIDARQGVPGVPGGGGALVLPAFCLVLRLVWPRGRGTKQRYGITKRAPAGCADVLRCTPRAVLHPSPPHTPPPPPPGACGAHVQGLQQPHPPRLRGRPQLPAAGRGAADSSGGAAERWGGVAAAPLPLPRPLPPQRPLGAAG